MQNTLKKQMIDNIQNFYKFTAIFALISAVSVWER